MWFKLWFKLYPEPWIVIRLRVKWIVACPVRTIATWNRERNIEHINSRPNRAGVSWRDGRKKTQSNIYSSATPCTLCVEAVWSSLPVRSAVARRRLGLLSLKTDWRKCKMLKGPLLSAFTVRLLLQSRTASTPRESWAEQRCATVLPQSQPDRVTELISVTVQFTVFMSVVWAAGSQLQGEQLAEFKTYRGSQGATECWVGKSYSALN